MSQNAPPFPLPVFNFRVDFHRVTRRGTADQAVTPICSGRFSEVSGLEATMEPKTIREGGRNHGELQRAGLVKFSTVILKRGLTTAPDLWTWFDLVARGKTAVRMEARVIQLAQDGATPVLTWTMANALPVKFKAAAYIAASSEVGVEELHFVHEDLKLEIARGGGSGGGAGQRAGGAA